MDITELKAIIDANIFENTSQAITGDALNDVLNLIADSLGEYVPVADIFDEAGTIRSSLLPSYVDDVLEFSTRDAFPAVGEGGKIYLAADTNLSYRWGGSEYVIIAQSLALGETSSTAYRGDRGKIAYDHSQTSHRLNIAGLEVSALGGAIETDALASALSIPEIRTAVAAHIGDGSIHITADERTAWNKFASLFGIDDKGDIYIKADENGRNRGLYSYSFLSSGGKSDTPGTGGGTVVGATVGGVDVKLIDGVLKFDAYPTASSLGLGNIAFKDSLTIADVANLQSALDGKQNVISDLVTIRNNANNGATAYSWGNHASAGYALASNLTAHTDNSTIHITAAERTAWNNKYDKPASGIPYADLADSVKSALDKAHEHANKTSVLDKLKWNEDKNAIYIGDENNRINFFVYGGVASGGFSDTPGAGSGTVVGATVGGKEVKLSGGILEFDAYPTTTSLGLKNLAFKESLSFSEITSKPTTISGYGITDAYTASTIDSKLSGYLPLSGGTMNGIITMPVNCQIQWGDDSKMIYGSADNAIKLFSPRGLYINDNLVIHSGNYNSYSPKLDGTGASGTWGISISGNAATATNAENISSLYPQLAAPNEADEINIKRLIAWNQWGGYGTNLQAAIDFNWYETHNLFGVIRGGGMDSAGFGWMYSSDGSTYTPIARLSPSGDFTILGAITGVTNITASGNATIAGNVGIGTTSPAYKLDVAGTARISGNTIIDGTITLPVNYQIQWGTTGYMIYGTTERIQVDAPLQVSNTVTIKSTLTVSGQTTINNNLLATGAVTAGQASDARLKSNIVTVMNACGILRSLRGVEFDWNAIATENCKDLTGHDVGLIAQEVESLIPSAIGTIWGEYKRLDYTKITPYLVEGWKAHDDEIQRLKAEIIELKKKIYGLEKQ